MKTKASYFSMILIAFTVQMVFFSMNGLQGFILYGGVSSLTMVVSLAGYQIILNANISNALKILFMTTFIVVVVVSYTATCYYVPLPQRGASTIKQEGFYASNAMIAVVTPLVFLAAQRVWKHLARRFQDPHAT